ncbi:DUF2577 domain-containing protein [Virgibacillus dokdonensis]|uniref:DUF2577 domain-containing protein n=1 Tax=Virgibacillus dokdonensis TaxID=302167 RepID=A0A2K9IZR3_9BACI|nr:DUF2577 domain-containing protein [Virgibacillus dokdonensis]AUJ25197.1 hypothetical protein A21D_02133 [Virgibacillus dokdonensis]
MSIGQTIKKMAKEAVDASKPLQFVEGVIHSISPVQLRLKQNDKLIIPSDFIHVARHLTQHTRTATISTGSVGEKMTLAGDPEHAHNIHSITLNNATIHFSNALQTGDKVMVAVIQGGQSFFIIDKF